MEGTEQGIEWTSDGVLDGSHHLILVGRGC